MKNPVLPHGYSRVLFHFTFFTEFLQIIKHNMI
jgi:hypothetical protein